MNCPRCSMKSEILLGTMQEVEVPRMVASPTSWSTSPHTFLFKDPHSLFREFFGGNDPFDDLIPDHHGLLGGRGHGGLGHGGHPGGLGHGLRSRSLLSDLEEMEGLLAGLSGLGLGSFMGGGLLGGRATLGPTVRVTLGPTIRATGRRARL